MLICAHCWPPTTSTLSYCALMLMCCWCRHKTNIGNVFTRTVGVTQTISINRSWPFANAHWESALGVGSHQNESISQQNLMEFYSVRKNYASDLPCLLDIYLTSTFYVNSWPPKFPLCIATHCVGQVVRLTTVISNIIQGTILHWFYKLCVTRFLVTLNNFRSILYFQVSEIEFAFL